MNNVFDIGAVSRQLRTSGEPPDNGDMDAHITKLEGIAEKTGERLAGIDLNLVKVDSRLDHIEKTMAEMPTKDGMKAAISDAKNSIIMWIVSALFLAQLLPALLKKLGL